MTIDSYNASQALDPDEWLELDESFRIELVRAYHDTQEEGLAEDARQLHAVIHVIVENQVALGEKPIPETIAKLTRQGLNRHEAVHAIGAVLTEDIFDVMKGNKQEFPLNRYRRRIEKLTAKRWKKGQL